jgi:hypothetical protein
MVYLQVLKQTRLSLRGRSRGNALATSTEHVTFGVLDQIEASFQPKIAGQPDLLGKQLSYRRPYPTCSACLSQTEGT